MNDEIQELIDIARPLVGEIVLGRGMNAATTAAAIRTKAGNIYTGVCIDLACGIGFCAEHAAVADMIKNRETQIEMVVAVNNREIRSPCGRCRELMALVDPRNRDAKVVLADNRTVRLGELLPEHWLASSNKESDS